MAVPKITETRTVYMQQDRYNSNTMRNSIHSREELCMVLLLYAILPCLAAYNNTALVSQIFGTGHSYIFQHSNEIFLLHLFHWFFIVCRLHLLLTQVPVQSYILHE